MVNNSIYVEKFLLRINEANIPGLEADFTDDVKIGDEFTAYLVSVANIENNHRYLVAAKKLQGRSGQLRGGPKIVLYDGDKTQAAEEVLGKMRQDLRDHGYWNAENWAVPFPGSVSVDGVFDALFADFE
jgi:hypothetical protein